MMTVVIIDNDGSFEPYNDVTIVPAGVIIQVSKISEVFVPWHRVREIYSNHRGSIAEAMGQEMESKS